MKGYTRHTQKHARHFLDYVIKKCPFRMHTVRTDRGHEFQAQFHWHLADHGIRHVYSTARTPQLNGQVERSHRTDKQECYQLLTYTGDVDLNEKLVEWENFYNYLTSSWSVPGQDTLRSPPRKARMSYSLSVHRGRTDHNNESARGGRYGVV